MAIENRIVLKNGKSFTIDEAMELRYELEVLENTVQYSKLREWIRDWPKPGIYEQPLVGRKVETMTYRYIGNDLEVKFTFKD